MDGNLRQRKAVFLARNVRRKKLGQPDIEKEIKGLGPVAVPVPASEGNDVVESEKPTIERKKKEKMRFVEFCLLGTQCFLLSCLCSFLKHTNVFFKFLNSVLKVMKKWRSVKM